MKTCSLCDKKVHAKGWCRQHYEHRRASGDPSISKKKPKLSEEEARLRIKEAKRRYKKSAKGKLSKKRYQNKLRDSGKVKERESSSKRKIAKSLWSKTEKGKKSSRYNLAKRRSRKQKATPVWLNKEDYSQIKEIYNNVPEGHHVDHIVPLRAQDNHRNHIACGLHVPWNLQYLTVTDNLKKNAKLQ